MSTTVRRPCEVAAPVAGMRPATDRIPLASNSLGGNRPDAKGAEFYGGDGTSLEGSNAS